ncbi:hypothetical protein AAG570_011143 [Ranatra chinensis]|uniref:Uncharacterized protein n=1 Tax=Ranatra chinensis TaxID=642074 RepID=A0ABD0YK09_9HEMI
MFQALVGVQCLLPRYDGMRHMVDWHPMEPGMGYYSRPSRFVQNKPIEDPAHREHTTNATRNDMEFVQPSWNDPRRFQEMPFYGPPMMRPQQFMMPHQQPVFPQPYMKPRTPERNKGDNKQQEPKRTQAQEERKTINEPEEDNVGYNFIEMAPPMGGPRYMPVNFMPTQTLMQPPGMPVMGVPRSVPVMPPMGVRPTLMGGQPPAVDMIPRFGTSPSKRHLADETFFPGRTHQLFKREDTRRNRTAAEPERHADKTPADGNSTREQSMSPVGKPEKHEEPEHIFSPQFDPNGVRFVHPPKYEENNVMFRPPQVFNPHMFGRFPPVDVEDQPSNKQLALFNEILRKLSASQDPRFMNRFVNYGPPREHYFEPPTPPKAEPALEGVPLRGHEPHPHRVPHSDIDPHNFHHESETMIHPPARNVRGNPEIEAPKCMPHYVNMQEKIGYPRRFEKMPMHPYDVEHKFYGPPRFVDPIEAMNGYDARKPFEIPKRIHVQEPPRMVDPFFIQRQRVPFENFGKGEMIFDGYRKPAECPFMIQMKDEPPHLSRRVRDLSAIEGTKPSEIDSNAISGLFRKFLPLVRPMSPIPTTSTTSKPEIITNSPPQPDNKSQLSSATYTANTPYSNRSWHYKYHYPYYVYPYAPSYYDPRTYVNAHSNNYKALKSSQKVLSINETKEKPKYQSDNLAKDSTEYARKQAPTTINEYSHYGPYHNNYITPYYVRNPLPNQFQHFKYEPTYRFRSKIYHDKLMPETYSKWQNEIRPQFYVRDIPHSRHYHRDNVESYESMVKSNEIPGSSSHHRYMFEPAINQERLRRQLVSAPQEATPQTIGEIGNPSDTRQFDKTIRIHLHPRIRVRLLCVHPGAAEERTPREDSLVKRLIDELGLLRHARDKTKDDDPMILGNTLSNTDQKQSSNLAETLFGDILNKLSLHDAPCRVVKTIRYIGGPGQSVTKIIDTDSNGNGFERIIRERAPKMEDTFGPLDSGISLATPRIARHVFEYPHREVAPPRVEHNFIDDILRKFGLADNPNLKICIVRTHRLPDGTVEKIVERGSSADFGSLHRTPDLPSFGPLIEPTDTASVLRRPRHSVFESPESAQPELPDIFKDILGKLGKPSYFRRVRYERGPGDSFSKVVETSLPSEQSPEAIPDIRRPSCLVRTVRMDSAPGSSAPEAPAEAPNMLRYLMPLALPFMKPNASSTEDRPDFVFRTVRFEKGPGDAITKVVETRTTKRQVIRNPASAQDDFLTNILGHLRVPTIRLRLIRMNAPSDNGTEELPPPCPAPSTPTTPSPEPETMTTTSEPPAAQPVIAQECEETNSSTYYDILNAITSVLCPSYLTRPKSLITEAFQRFKGSS